LVSNDLGQQYAGNTLKRIQSVALDWETRINFFNSIIAAIASIFVIYSNSSWAAVPAALAVTVVAVLADFGVFASIWLWISSHKIGDLAATKKWGVSREWVCKVVLVLVNIGLLLLIIFLPN
jgi:hypothetical protein